MSYGPQTSHGDAYSDGWPLIIVGLIGICMEWNGPPMTCMVPLLPLLARPIPHHSPVALRSELQHDSCNLSRLSPEGVRALSAASLLHDAVLDLALLCSDCSQRFATNLPVVVIRLRLTSCDYYF